MDKHYQPMFNYSDLGQGMVADLVQRPGIEPVRQENHRESSFFIILIVHSHFPHNGEVG